MRNIKNSRTYEIVSKTLEELCPYSWFIQVAQTKDTEHRANKFLKELDAICTHCERKKENTNPLSERLKEVCKGQPAKYLQDNALGFKSRKSFTETEHEIYRQIRDFFNELQAYGWLYDKGYSSLLFIPKNNHKTPDLQCYKGKSEFFVEVKTLHIPRDYEQQMMRPYIIARDLDRNYHDGLKKKIEYFVDNANKKFNRVRANNRVLMLFYELSGDVLIANEIANKEENQDLDDILGSTYFDDLEKNNKMKIIKISEV